MLPEHRDNSDDTLINESGVVSVVADPDQVLAWEYHQRCRYDSYCQMVPQARSNDLDLVMCSDRLMMVLCPGPIVAPVVYRTAVIDQMCLLLNRCNTEVRYEDPFHLIPLDDSELQWMTFHIVRHVMMALPRSRLAVAQFLPQLSEDSALLRMGKVPIATQVLVGVLAGYQKYHIANREDLDRHLATLDTYDTLMTDSLFEVIQVAVFGGLGTDSDFGAA